MIVRAEGGLLVLVRQCDHDDQCGHLAAALRAGYFPNATARRALCLAAFLHDNGWAPWEEHPQVDPETGRPLQFTQVDPAAWCALYRDGITTAVEADPLAGLLVSLHGLGLRRHFLGIRGDTDWRTPPEDEDPEVERFCEEQELLQDELIARLRDERDDRETAAVLAGTTVPTAENPDAGGRIAYGPTLLRLYTLLELLDALSLRLNWRGLSEEPLGPVPDLDPTRPNQQLAVRRVDDHTLALTPSPFDAATIAAPVAARLLPDRPYTQPDFALAFATAEVVSRSFTIVAGDGRVIGSAAMDPQPRTPLPPAQ
jgi:hypothetical protein